jgi:AraC family transcriptional regulator
MESSDNNVVHEKRAFPDKHIFLLSDIMSLGRCIEMNAWEQIQNTIDYIEDHLNQQISIADLAEKAGLSQFYYQRLFRRLVKKPVAEYIRLRRMAKAVDILLDENQRILDIAQDLGFETHEHFSRTFKKTYGMTPTEYRKKPQILNHMTKPELLLNYVLIDEGVPLITNGIVLEMNRKHIKKDVTYIGFTKKLSLEYGAGLSVEPGVDILGILWDEIHAYKNQVLGTVTGSEEVGVMLPCSENGFYNYFAGIHANVNNCEMESKMDKWIQPQGEYIVCSFEAENFVFLVTDALYKAQQYLFSTWLPNHKLQTEAFCLEYYDTHTPETTKMELWMKLTEGQDCVMN